MKKSLSILFLFFCMISLPLTAAETEQEIIKAAVKEWNSVIKTGTAEDIIALYADDAILLQPNGKVSTAPEEIKDFWQKLIATRSGEYKIDTAKVVYAGEDTIVSTTKWSNVLPLPERSMKYSYDGVIYNVLKRQNDGSWKAQVQEWY